MNSGPDRIEIFRDIASKKKVRPKAPPTYRRRIAVVMGMLFGLVYALLSQFANSILAPTIPFAHYPFGVIGNLLVDVLGFGLVCFVCSLPEDEYRGALFASLTVFLILDARAWALGSPGVLLQLISPLAPLVIFSLILEIGVSLPLMIALRWAIDIYHEHYGQPSWAWPRIRLPLGLMLAVLILGLLSIYPDDVRRDMAVMNDLIAEARSAPTAAASPVPLRDDNRVHELYRNVRADYTLEEGDASLMAEDLPPVYQASPVVIIARFRGGWTLACSFAHPADEPVCRSFEPSLAPPIDDLRAGAPRQDLN